MTSWVAAPRRPNRPDWHGSVNGRSRGLQTRPAGETVALLPSAALSGGTVTSGILTPASFGAASVRVDASMESPPRSAAVLNGSSRCHPFERPIAVAPAAPTTAPAAKTPAITGQRLRDKRGRLYMFRLLMIVHRFCKPVPRVPQRSDGELDQHAPERV